MSANRWMVMRCAGDACTPAHPPAQAKSASSNGFLVLCRRAGVSLTGARVARTLKMCLRHVRVMHARAYAYLLHTLHRGENSSAGNDLGCAGGVCTPACTPAHGGGKGGWA